MRIWDADPRHLCDKHLLGEHFEVHVLLRTLEGKSSGWKGHPEVRRFAEHKNGRLYAMLRHELLRHEMGWRWKQHVRHHATHVILDPLDIMQVAVELLLPVRTHPGFTWESYLETIDWPRTRLEHGTPWERDGVSFEWYREHERTWSRELVSSLRSISTPAVGTRLAVG